MASTKLYLDLRGKAKDGKGTICVTITNNQTCATVGTGVRVSPKEWNGTRVIKHQDAELLNAKINKVKSEIDTQIAILRLEPKFLSMSATDIRRSLKKEKAVRIVKHLVSDVFAEYLEQDLKTGTKRLYLATLEKIKRFAGDIDIKDIDYKWLISFEKYLSETRGVNGRAIDLRNLRAVCNYAINTEIISNYAFKNFSVKQEPTRKRSISIDKLRELYKCDCTPAEQRYKEYFFLMFFLIGINAKDLFLAKPSALVNGRLEYIRNKTNKKYSIKIESEAQGLLSKYKGQKYLVEVMDKVKDYINFLHEMNDALGQIGYTETIEVPSENLFELPKIQKIKVPIIKDLTTYYARHTWATIAYEIGIPIDVISQALGHSMGNKTTLIYIKSDQTKVDIANRKVIDYFFSGL